MLLSHHVWTATKCSFVLLQNHHPLWKCLLMLNMLLHLRTIETSKSYPWLCLAERVMFQVRLANIRKFSDIYVYHVKCLHKPLDKNHSIQFCFSGTTEHFKARINLAQPLDNIFTQPGLKCFYRVSYSKGPKPSLAFTLRCYFTVLGQICPP